MFIVMTFMIEIDGFAQARFFFSVHNIGTNLGNKKTRRLRLRKDDVNYYPNSTAYTRRTLMKAVGRVII
jgi:hypothetical protein